MRQYDDEPSGMTQVMSKRFEGRLSDLRPALLWMETALALLGAGHISGDVTLAAGEVVTNIIRHGYDKWPDDRAGKTIDIELRHAPGRLEVVFTDHSEPAADLRALYAAVPTVAELPDIEALSEGGRGILLIKAVTESCSYERTAAGNVLRLGFLT